MRISYLLLFIVFNALAIDISKYQEGTFISILVDVESGEPYYAPTDGARWANGDLLPNDKVVNRYGGHGQIARSNNLNLREREVYAGGILIKKDGTHQIKIKSISVNGSRTSDYLVPKRYRYWFAESIAELVEESVELEGRVILYRKIKPNICHSLYY